MTLKLLNLFINQNILLKKKMKNAKLLYFKKIKIKINLIIFNKRKDKELKVKIFNSHLSVLLKEI